MSGAWSQGGAGDKISLAWALAVRRTSPVRWGCSCPGGAQSEPVMSEKRPLQGWGSTLELSSSMEEGCASLVAQMVKNLPAMREAQVLSLGREDPLEQGKGNPLQYSCLENSMDRDAGGSKSMRLVYSAWDWSTVHGVAESDRTEANTFTVHARGSGQASRAKLCPSHIFLNIFPWNVENVLGQTWKTQIDLGNDKIYMNRVLFDGVSDYHSPILYIWSAYMNKGGLNNQACLTFNAN